MKILLAAITLAFFLSSCKGLEMTKEDIEEQKRIECINKKFNWYEND